MAHFQVFRSPCFQMDLGSLSIKPKNFLFKSVFLFSSPPPWYRFREVTTGSCWHLSLAGKRATSIKQINCYQHLSLVHLSSPIHQTSLQTQVQPCTAAAVTIYLNTHTWNQNSLSPFPCDVSPLFCPINILLWSTEAAIPVADKNHMHSSQRRYSSL